MKLAKFVYNDIYQRVSVTDALSNTTAYTFDGVGNVLTVTDALGNITTNQFDEIYRRIAVVDDLGNWTLFTFDDANNLLTVRDAENKITTNTYNELNRQVTTTDAIGAVVTKTYDANGNLSSITDDNGNTTSYEFDELNRLVTTTYADNGTVVSTYDSNSNVLTTIDQNGTIVTNTFDNLNRLTARAINRGSGVVGTTLQTFVYDKIGILVEAFDNNDPNTTVDDATILYTFDDVNRVITETLEIGPAGNPDYTYTNTSAYNEISRISLTYPSAKVVEYTHTDLNQIDTISSDSTTIVDYGYNAVGLVITKAFANGVVSTSTFDDIYRETQRDVVYNGTTDIIKMHYYHDNVGNRLFEKREWAGYSKGDYHTYDDIYRLTGTKYEVPGTELDAFETYGFIPTTYVKYQDFTMDDVGNRTAFDDDGTSHGYTINDMNEYSQIDSTNRTYDDNGNLIDDGMLEYTWDFANRLIAAYDSTTNDLVESYTFDARGRRITKYIVSTAQGIIYVHDSDHVLETRDASDDSLRSRFVYGISIDEPVEKENNSNKHYYHANSLGSVVALTDENGSAFERYEYDVYGKPTIWDSTRTNNRVNSLCSNYIMFTGRWYDKATELYYYRVRMYSPNEGRFLSHDPLEYMGSMELYEYVNSNPVNKVDVFGLIPTDSDEIKVIQQIIGAPEINGKYDIVTIYLVRQFQRQLKETGYYSGVDDGDWGVNTEKAYQSWLANYYYPRWSFEQLTSVNFGGIVEFQDCGDPILWPSGSTTRDDIRGVIKNSCLSLMKAYVFALNYYATSGGIPNVDFLRYNQLRDILGDNSKREKLLNVLKGSVEKCQANNFVIVCEDCTVAEYSETEVGVELSWPDYWNCEYIHIVRERFKDMGQADSLNSLIAYEITHYAGTSSRTGKTLENDYQEIINQLSVAWDRWYNNTK